MKKRNTKQKEFVLDYLKGSYDHPTVSQIYDYAKSNGINIGEVSIYRILNNLVEDGVVCKILTKDNLTHYDYKRDNHFHLICNSCNKIIDKPLSLIFDEKFKELTKGFCITKQDINLYGICEECKKKKNGI